MAPKEESADVEVGKALAVNTSSKQLKHAQSTALTSQNSFLMGAMKKDLVWSNVNMKLLDDSAEDGVKKHILKDVWGKAEAGKTTAIMGASGAGKTSLFQTLAGRVSSKGSIQVEGDIYLGGVRIQPNEQQYRKHFAYVSQEDSLHATSTPREALAFSAKLRLPRTMSDKDITNIVDQCIDELGLGAAADSVIGNSQKKGISGGEKRRVSIGVELVASPSIIFMDEPTSGLDSFAAAKVMDLLGRVAKAGNTVLFTIHQPSSNVFSRFDNLILLNSGRVMHRGAVANVSNDFDNYGCPVPANYNPADWVIDVAQSESIEELERKGFFAAEPSTNSGKCSEDGELLLPESNSVSAWRELILLQQREARNLRRNPIGLIINVFLTSFLSIIFGVIFLGVGREERTDFAVVQSQLGAIVNVLIATMMGQSQTAAVAFSIDRPVFMREYSTNHYTIVPYFLSKLWVEALNGFVGIMAQALITYWLMGFQMNFGQYVAITYSLAMTATAVAVLLGAFFTDPQNASALFTLVVVPQFYFSGLFIAIELIPSWVSWAQYLCSLTFASRLGFAYEFGDCEPGLAQQNCDAVLEANNVSVEDTWWYWLSLLGLFVGFRIGAILVLRSKARY